MLQPAITFTLAAEPAAAEQAGAEDDWRRLARTVAQLQQLECTEDVLGAQVHMVDAAEQGDRLAMAALRSELTRWSSTPIRAVGCSSMR